MTPVAGKSFRNTCRGFPAVSCSLQQFLAAKKKKRSAGNCCSAPTSQQVLRFAIAVPPESLATSKTQAKLACCCTHLPEVKKFVPLTLSFFPLVFLFPWCFSC